MPRGPLGLAVETLVTARQERGDMLSATVVIAASERDARLARRLQPRAKVRVVPNSIPVAYWKRNGPTAEKPTVVMTATYFWPPNQQAAQTLVTEVFPKVLGDVPDAELLLVGQGMPGWLQALVDRSPGVRATGQVDDVRPYLHQAWVAVAPLRRAGGSQVKVMEALASGVPTVTTRAVAAALGVGEADGVLAADAHGMGETITRLLRDPAQRAMMSERCVQAARTRFDREPAARLQEDAWLEALGLSRQSAAGTPR
jgi:glycosyltransferase involved in cell wall biosynthesis